MQIPFRLFILMLALAIVPPALAGAKLARKSVAVEILPASPADREAVGQIKRIVVKTLEEYRNMLTRRFLTDKDQKAAEQLKLLVEEGNKQVQVGKQNSTFDTGERNLNKAYLKAKGLLGELDADLVASLYRGMALAQVVLKNPSLAGQYMAVLLNLKPGTTRRSLQYTEEFAKTYDRVMERLKAGGKTAVEVACDVPEAVLRVDGKVLKGNPATVSVTVGGHLVQAEADGFYRAGWIKDPTLAGDRWEIALRPIESRERYVTITRQLIEAYGGQTEEKPSKRSRWKKKKVEAQVDPEPLLHSLHRLFRSDHLFFSVVKVRGDKVIFEGAYVSSWGIVPFKEVVSRDATIIGAVRKSVLAVSDVGKHRLAHLDRKSQREQAQVEAIRSQLENDMSHARNELTRRSHQWKTLGEDRKATLFAHTAREVAGLQSGLSEALAGAEGDYQQQHKALRPVRQEWQTLESKVRSLLAWDVAGALKAAQLKKAARLRNSADEKLAALKTLLKDKQGSLEKKEARAWSKRMRDIANWLKKADRLARKNPMEPKARQLILKALLHEAEMTRQLSLR